MEKMLQSENYWYNRIKNDDVKYGYFENPTFILFCNKLNRTLKIFSYKNGKLTKITQFNNIIVGKLGQKEKAGDLRTPIGDYRLIAKLIPKNTFYGPLAFVTSYPNLYDKLHHKTGYGIWVHGKPLDGERGDVSKGCIVLDNNQILYLNKIINYKKTVLEITQSPLYANKKDIAEILALLYKWRDAWQSDDLKKYLSYYNPKTFHRANGDDFKKFAAYKKRVFRNKRWQTITIYFRNIKIMPYQNLDDKRIYQINFYEIYHSNDFDFQGYKELYVAKNDKGKFKIIIEK
jgi:murein L,D-transpeptidase YafK